MKLGKIRVWVPLGMAGIALAVALCLIIMRTSLDLSEVPGSILFTYYDDEIGMSNIWKINVADGEKELFLPEREDGAGIRDMWFDNFCYIPGERTLVEFKPGDTGGLFRVFARADGSAEFREKAAT
jgi:hypothetical protein